MTEPVRKSLRPSVPAPAGNTATGILKLIALVFMFIDHSGKVLFKDMVEMRTLGRIAFPLYAWCMIVGFSRTRNVTRYLMRILLVGLISQPLYLFALNTEGHIGVLIERTFLPLSGGYTAEGLRAVMYTIFLEKPNIFLSLLLGLIALCAVREEHWIRKAWFPGCFVLGLAVLGMIHTKKLDPVLEKIFVPFAHGFSPEALGKALRIMLLNPPNYFFVIILAGSLVWAATREDRRPGQVWGPALMLVLANMLSADYGWRGILFFLVLYAVQDSRRGIAAVSVSYMLFWGSGYAQTAALFGENIRLSSVPESISTILRSLLRSEAYALAGLPLILIRFPRDLRLPKWLSYFLYPGHLVLLILLKIFQFGWFA